MTASFSYVIVSGYKTPRQQFYTGGAPLWTNVESHTPWRARTLEIAKFVACEVGARRKHLVVVKNFGTRYERVVWEKA